MNSQMKRGEPYIAWGLWCLPEHKSFCPCGVGIRHPPSTELCSPTRELSKPESAIVNPFNSHLNSIHWKQTLQSAATAILGSYGLDHAVGVARSRPNLRHRTWRSHYSFLLPVKNKPADQSGLISLLG